MVILYPKKDIPDSFNGNAEMFSRARGKNSNAIDLKQPQPYSFKGVVEGLSKERKTRRLEF